MGVEPRTISQSVANGLGFSMSGSRWSIKPRARDCIIKEMAKRGFGGGKVEEETFKNDNFYRFDFPDGEKIHSFRIEYGEKGLVVEYDLEGKENQEQGGEDAMNKFFESLTACGRTLGSKTFPMVKQPVAPFQEPAPAPKYGYADEGRNSELEDAMAKLSVGKGRKKSRRQKKRRATRRR